MKVYVDDNCIGCGLCAGTCPAVFTLTDAGKAEAMEGDIPHGEFGNTEEARDNCPVEAIHTS